MSQYPEIINLSAVREQVDDTALTNLSRAANAATSDGGGIGWIKPIPTEVMARYWKDRFYNPNDAIFIASQYYQNRKPDIIGAAIVAMPDTEHSPTTYFRANLQRFFVHPEARGKGVGKRLLSAACHYADRKGIRHLYLDVRETQDAALKLYKSFGFSVWGIMDDYAMVDGVTYKGYHMVKDLKK